MTSLVRTEFSKSLDGFAVIYSLDIESETINLVTSFIQKNPDYLTIYHQQKKEFYYIIASKKKSFLNYSHCAKLIDNLTSTNYLQTPFCTKITEDQAFRLLYKEVYEIPTHLFLNVLDDPTIFKYLLGKVGSFLKDLPKEMKNDKEIVKIAVKSGHNAFEYASEELKDDIDFVLEVERLEKHSYQFASEKARSDKELAIKVIKMDWINFKYCSDKLKKDKDVLLSFLDVYYNSSYYNSYIYLNWIPEEHLTDRNIMLILFDKMLIVHPFESFPKLSTWYDDDEISKKFVLRNPNLLNVFHPT